LLFTPKSTPTIDQLSTRDLLTVNLIVSVIGLVGVIRSCLEWKRFGNLLDLLAVLFVASLLISTWWCTVRELLRRRRETSSRVASPENTL